MMVESVDSEMEIARMELRAEVTGCAVR